MSRSKHKAPALSLQGGSERANYYSEQQIEKARATDLLSYMTLMNLETGRWLAEPMLSLGGVYKPSGDPSKRKVPVALQNMLENHPEVTTIHLHLDNDTAGRAAACNIDDQLKNRYNVRLEFPPRGKDYNDYLMYMRKRQSN